jgi:DNA adenine methylase
VPGAAVNGDIPADGDLLCPLLSREAALLDTQENRSRPFLRWAGGKAWLVRRARQIFGELRFNAYHEPFLGGGAFFFGLVDNGPSYLSDANAELIETYDSLRLDAERVITIMETFQNTPLAYYAIRQETPECRFRRAARFIYLNQTSFNGIFRVNLKGVYNVPYGARTKPFLDAPTLRQASKALASATLVAGDFQSSLKHVKEGDLVFIDPPYTVSHNLNGFIKYNQALFSIEDQHRLAAYIRELRNLGARYIFTNAAHTVIKEIFEAGDSQIEVSRASLIGGKNAIRGPVSEYIFTNLEVVHDGDSERGKLFRGHGRSRGSADARPSEG